MSHETMTGEAEQAYAAWVGTAPDSTREELVEQGMAIFRQVRALAEVREERTRQMAKFPDQMETNTPGLWAVILGEEFGEVCRAIMEMKFAAQRLEDHSPHRRNLRKECIQVAAVAVALVEQLDAEDGKR